MRSSRLFLLLCAAVLAGCAQSTRPTETQIAAAPQADVKSPASVDAQATPAEPPAKRAARLANEECERLYGKRPFRPDSFEAKFEGNRWHWGRLDPFGEEGYSSEVSFARDGSEPDVRIFLSNDRVQMVDPEKIRQRSTQPDEQLIERAKEP